MSFIDRIYSEAAAKSEARELARSASWQREADYCTAKGWYHMAKACRASV